MDWTPHPFQYDLIQQAVSGLRRGDKATILSAPGTGKSFMARRVAETVASELKGPVVIVVPTINLIRQMAAVWADSPWPIAAVCSDRATRNNVVCTTTASGELAQVLDDEPNLMFITTYHSFGAALDACRINERDIGLLVVDEAHRTAGSPNRMFSRPANEKLAPAQYRLFLSATPKVSAQRGDYSMSFPDGYNKVYGYQCGPYTARDGIADEVLSDCMVRIILSDLPHRLYDPRLAGAVQAIKDFGLRSGISFHSTKANADLVTTMLPVVADDMGTKVETCLVTGETRDDRRQEAINWVTDAPPGVTRILTSVRVFVEGVDVPALDSVFLFEPSVARSSLEQKAGRAMRKADGKTHGTVVILDAPDEPLPPGTPLTSTKAKSVFKMMKAVLQGLGSPAWANTGGYSGAARGPTHGVTDERIGKYVTVDTAGIMLPASAASLNYMIDGDTTLHEERMWDCYQAHLAAGGPPVPSRDYIDPDGEELGRFVYTKRRLQHTGELSQFWQDRFDAVPGFTWHQWDTFLADNTALLARYYAATQISAPAYTVHFEGVPLGRRYRAICKRINQGTVSIDDLQPSDLGYPAFFGDTAAAAFVRSCEATNAFYLRHGRLPSKPGDQWNGVTFKQFLRIEKTSQLTDWQSQMIHDRCTACEQPLREFMATKRPNQDGAFIAALTDYIRITGSDHIPEHCIHTHDGRDWDLKTGVRNMFRRKNLDPQIKAELNRLGQYANPNEVKFDRGLASLAALVQVEGERPKAYKKGMTDKQARNWYYTWRKNCTRGDVTLHQYERLCATNADFPSPPSYHP